MGWVIALIPLVCVPMALAFGNALDVPLRSGPALGYAVLVGAGASVGLCRRWPAASLGIVTGVLTVYLLRNYAGGPVYVTGWIALFFLSWRSSRRTAIAGAAVLCSVLILTGLITGNGAFGLHLVFVGWSAAAVFLGEALRNRRSYLTELEERARHLEHSREEEARRRVAEDRLRIARDLHDSVAHAIATIIVQSGASAHDIDRRHDAAKDALPVIQRASAEVLDELGAMLRLLRDDDESAARAPMPGVGEIPELVASVRDAHLPVTLEQSGELDAVPAAVGTAAYRIVQESLTNVLRHADAAPTSVCLRVDDRRFTVEVKDEGTGGPGMNGAGMGIRGMRERAEATGGTLEAGPRDGRGFTVRAAWSVRP
jgi:signal transduction histidine kinase